MSDSHTYSGLVHKHSRQYGVSAAALIGAGSVVVAGGAISAAFGRAAGSAVTATGLALWAPAVLVTNGQTLYEHCATRYRFARHRRTEQPIYHTLTATTDQGDKIR